MQLTHSIDDQWRFPLKYVMNPCSSREFSTRSLDLSSTSSLSSGSRWTLIKWMLDCLIASKKITNVLTLLQPLLILCHSKKYISNQGRFTVKKEHTTGERGSQGRIRLTFLTTLFLMSKKVNVIVQQCLKRELSLWTKIRPVTSITPVHKVIHISSKPIYRWWL